ncbi:heavy metal translocating P-type ATPase [Chitinophaga sp. RAB17]|uniref:heavy metal translocating P-type ATPase n=1 Tax=Chitinophaga sp. RAB17 TaxID=3233049 RepID=UPI003F90CD35
MMKSTAAEQQTDKDVVPATNASSNGHQHDADHDHDHEHGGVFGKNTELFFSIICGVLLGLGFAISFIQSLPAWLSLSLYIGAYFFGGFYTTKEAVESIAKGKFEIDFLMLVAAIGAAILGDWEEGALLLFLFSMGHALEHYAMNKARKSIAALAELAPKTAIVRRNNEEKEITIEELLANDIIIVKPNSKISADGIVIKGSSSVNQAPITGESIPVDKTPVADPQQADKNVSAEHKVFAGTINGSQVLEIKVTSVAADSTLARLIKLVNETEAQKSPTQLFTDKFERYFVPIVLILVVSLLFAFLVIDETFSQSFYRAISVLVAASPCALAISTPSAVLSGIARAARSGVLIKGGGPLEELGSLTALAFDKTGTLTEGKPQLTAVVTLSGATEEEVLQVVIAVEKLSDHPLAAAIVKGGQEKLKREVAAADGLMAVSGRGVKATYQGKQIVIGNPGLFEQEGKKLPADVISQIDRLEKEGNTTMIVQQDDQIIGLIALMDVPRKEAAATLAQLKEIGIKKIVMLTGDNQQVATAVANKIGIADAWGSLLPEQKVKAIADLSEQEGKVAMIGDGVNDAPAMAKSTVGIAMGAAGSAVALETADIALMADKLDNLPFAIALSRKSKGIIRQNLWMSLGMVAVLIPLTIIGVASIGVAVIAHEGSTLLVVFNGLRLLAFQMKK